LLVAIEPYLLYLLGQDDPALLNFYSTAYAIDIGLIMMILAGLCNRRTGPDTDKESIDQYRMDRNRFIGTALIFLVSALPFFWLQSAIFSVNLRFLIWMCAIVPGIAIRGLYRRNRTIDIDH
jgi:hypothetical protein